MERRNFLTGAIATLFGGLFTAKQDVISQFASPLRAIGSKKRIFANVCGMMPRIKLLPNDNPNSIDHTLNFTFITNNNGNIEELV